VVTPSRRGLCGLGGRRCGGCEWQSKGVVTNPPQTRHGGGAAAANTEAAGLGGRQRTLRGGARAGRRAAENG